jgi:anti-sigma B factor antagonist
MALPAACRGRSEMAITIERRTVGDVVVLELKGRATIGGEADRLNEALRKELSGGTRKLLANLTGMVQVDSSGLATLVRSFVSMGCSGGAMRLVVPPGRVRDVFDVTQLSRAITCYDDEASALASFK